MLNNILFSILGMLFMAVVGVGTATARMYNADTDAGQEPALVAPNEERESAAKAQAGETSVAVERQRKRVTVMDCVSVPVRSEHDDDGEEDDDDVEEEDDNDDARIHNGTTKEVCTPRTIERDAPRPHTSASQASAAAPESAQPVQNASSYTMADVRAHASATSCWSVIEGMVYDLTPFVSRHPGGSRAITSLCGVDGTAAYVGQHGGESKPMNELAPLKLGVLSAL